MLSQYWQAKPLCIKVTWFSKTAHTCTYAYMSAETADIPLSVNHPTQGGGLLYNVLHQEKSADHLVFTHRLLINIITITLMLPQHCCTVCITSVIRRGAVFHKNTLKWWKILLCKEIVLWDKKSGWGKSVLNLMKITGCPALCFEKKISAKSLYGLNWPHNLLLIYSSSKIPRNLMFAFF